ncbi:NAD-dependent protein deacylase [Halobacillus locisalis]|uniref:protein acetyllysine N-acetyltransferase n=1 Tax=Halobacillus locisalis TaxID=220753 RepID=A0A838CRB1_9BACI|nr:NAD-dependent protein deacylase [Halobacillus locisalis]MBA2174403.1 NAD-dependent protein deacylase [Halobacillus locisalis]
MYETVALHLKSSESITVLTGAGVSTASGIPDFRSSEGLWTEDHDREFYMSADYFFHDPEDFWKKYKAIFRIKLLDHYKPNVTHQFIKRLESPNREVTVITQNVDGLHGLAGSTNVIEYHGSLKGATCPNCLESYSLSHVMSFETPTCGSCGEYLKPDVLLFGDMITAHEISEKAVRHSEVLLVMGTSLLVTPFNMLPHYAKDKTTTILINNEPTPSDHLFDYVIHEDLSTTVEKLSEFFM